MQRTSTAVAARKREKSTNRISALGARTQAAPWNHAARAHMNVTVHYHSQQHAKDGAAGCKGAAAAVWRVAA